MVGDNGDGMCGSLEILMPFLQGQYYHKEFMIVDVIVVLGGGKDAREVCTGV